MGTNMWWMRLGQSEADIKVSPTGNCKVSWRDPGEGELIDAAQEGIVKAKR